MLHNFVARSIRYILVLFIGSFLVIGTSNIGDEPKTNYFDRWIFIMPDNLLVRVPDGCMNQIYESYYAYLERYYYCPNLDPEMRSVYIHLQSDAISYVSFRPINLYYGDLIAIYGPPTEITIIRGRVTSLLFGDIYVILDDRTIPLDYRTRVVTIGFLSNPYRRNR